MAGVGSVLFGLVPALLWIKAESARVAASSGPAQPWPDRGFAFPAHGRELGPAVVKSVWLA